DENDREFRSEKSPNPSLSTEGAQGILVLRIFNYSSSTVSAQLTLAAPDIQPPPPAGRGFGEACQDLPDRHDCADGLACLTFGSGGPQHDGFCSVTCDPSLAEAACPSASAGMSYCYIPSSDGLTYCGILCGEQYQLPDDCPQGLTC